MANTYTQIHLQMLFAVKYRAAMIQPSWKDELYKYISGIVTNNQHKILIVNGMPDHLHIVIGMRPVQSLSNLMQQIKGDSSSWINDQKLTRSRFYWQDGYAAFSYSHSHLNHVINYVKNQEIHHKKKTFLEEYKSFLKLYDVDFDDRYLFHEPL